MDLKVFKNLKKAWNKESFYCMKVRQTKDLVKSSLAFEIV